MFQVVRHVEFSLVYEQRQNSIDTWATNQNAGSISACCEWCIMARDERLFPIKTSRIRALVIVRDSTNFPREII